MSAATSVVPKKKISVFPPTRPSDRMSPSDATPTNTLATTSGTTTIVISRMNTVPTGSRYDHSGGERSHSAVRARASPTTTPAPNPSRIFRSSFTTRRPLGPRLVRRRAGGVRAHRIERVAQRIQRALDVGHADVAHVADAKSDRLERAESAGGENAARLDSIAQRLRRDARGQRDRRHRRRESRELGTLQRESELVDAFAHATSERGVPRVHCVKPFLVDHAQRFGDLQHELHGRRAGRLGPRLADRALHRREVPVVPRQLRRLARGPGAVAEHRPARVRAPTSSTSATR